jgi:uncharacterized membrane protein YeaQ/YmgE (transglycosylase-associated protein family)
MQAFVVRPVMTGLLALIIAGIWGTPLGTSGGGAFIYPSGCHGAARDSLSPAVAGAMIRRGVHC